MILNFKDKDSKDIFNGIYVKKFPKHIQEVGRRKLRMLNNAQSLQDLSIPPSNNLKKLKGESKEFYSIRINNQYRIIFKWIDGLCEEVQIIDYH